jgi:hypothetical protein
MLSEKFKIVPVANYLDISPATAYTDSIKMSNFHRATFILQIATLGGADSHLWAYSGAADATYTSALPFKYAFGGAAAGSASCDVLAAWTSNLSSGTPAAVHLTNATYSDYMMIVEVDAADMDMANQEEWLALGFLDTDGGATGNVTVIAVLEPRYTANRSATALA